MHEWIYPYIHDCGGLYSWDSWACFTHVILKQCQEPTFDLLLFLFIFFIFFPIFGLLFCVVTTRHYTKHSACLELISMYLCVGWCLTHISTWNWAVHSPKIFSLGYDYKQISFQWNQFVVWMSACSDWISINDYVTESCEHMPNIYESQKLEMKRQKINQYSFCTVFLCHSFPCHWLICISPAVQ